MRIIDKNAVQKASGIRFLAMDLDGTLLTDDKRFTERCAKAIEAAADLGIEPVYVTGRPFSGIPEDVLSVPGVRFAICSNGAVTLEKAGGRVIRSAGLDRDVSRGIIGVAAEKGHIFCVIADGFAYCNEYSMRKQQELFAGTPLEPYIENTRRCVPDVFEVIDTAGTIENLWIKAPDTALRDEVARTASALEGTRTVLTAPTDVEIGSPGADKGLAALHLAKLLGTEKDCIAAMGDNGNDIGMLGAAGLAVVMGNAGDDIKSMAQVIAGSNNEDGAAAVIEWIAACVKGSKG